jgi:hypothetical protein
VTWLGDPVAMRDHARKLLTMLADKGKATAIELGLSDADLAQAVAELSAFVDDDNQRVRMLRTWQLGEKITAVELTEHGHNLAAHTE